MDAPADQSSPTTFSAMIAPSSIAPVPMLRYHFSPQSQIFAVAQVDYKRMATAEKQVPIGINRATPANAVLWPGSVVSYQARWPCD